MSGASQKLKPKHQRALERFYFHEARLLDSRQYKQWLELVDPGIEYVMPARTNLLVNNRERGQEGMIAVERELEGPDGSYWRHCQARRLLARAQDADDEGAGGVHALARRVSTRVLSGAAGEEGTGAW